MSYHWSLYWDPDIGLARKPNDNSDDIDIDDPDFVVKKRRLYLCKDNFKTLHDLESWYDYVNNNKEILLPYKEYYEDLQSNLDEIGNINNNNNNNNDNNDIPTETTETNEDNVPNQELVGEEEEENTTTPLSPSLNQEQGNVKKNYRNDNDGESDNNIYYSDSDSDSETFKREKKRRNLRSSYSNSTPPPSSPPPPSMKVYTPNEILNRKITISEDDITTLEVDGILNAANSSLLGGGGVDGAIHRAAGPSLKKECKTLNGCKPGDAKITKAYKLPSLYVIHTVGPMNGNPNTLQSCYNSTLSIIETHPSRIKSFAFCCVATGIYGFPNLDAAHIALRTAREWLEVHHANVDRLIFCVFTQTDVRIYNELVHLYFPHPNATHIIDELENQDNN